MKEMIFEHLENQKCAITANCVGIPDFSAMEAESRRNALTIKKEPVTKLEVCLLVTVIVLVMCHVQLRYQVHHLESLLLSREDGPSDAPYTDVEFREYKTRASVERGKKLQERRFDVGADANTRDLTQITEKAMIKLSRHVRETTNNNKCNIKVQDVLQNYCNSLEKKDIPVKEPGPVRLRYDSYSTHFYSMFPYEEFKDAGNKWPSHVQGQVNVTVHGSNAMTFHNKGSPLGIYMNDGNNSLLYSPDKYSGKFTVNTKGLYILSLNITLEVEDMTANNSIAIALNKRIVLACPPGGFRCGTNLPDSNEYRVCNILGILQLVAGDVLEILTMTPDTRINIQNQRKSIFFITLLADN